MAIHKREQQSRSKNRFTGAVSKQSAVVQLHWEFDFFQATLMPAKRKCDIDEEINVVGARDQELQLRKHRRLLKRAVDCCNELPAQSATRREPRGRGLRKPRSRVCSRLLAITAIDQWRSRRRCPNIKLGSTKRIRPWTIWWRR